jgi:hypothetical protein
MTDVWFPWEPLESSGFEGTVLCWDTGMKKRKLVSSLLQRDGREPGERKKLPYADNQ